MADNRVLVADAMLVSAVRYALPRMTYMPSWTVDEAIRVWDDLSDNAKTVIERDVREALESGPLMQPENAESWLRLLMFIEMWKMQQGSEADRG